MWRGRAEGGAAARSSQTGGAARAGVSKSQAPGVEERGELAGEKRGGERLEVRALEECRRLEVRGLQGGGQAQEMCT